MARQLQSLYGVGQSDKGSWIRLGGFGIVDGLKGVAVKMECYYIRSIEADGIHLKGYRRKHGSVIHETHFKQPAEIYSAEEFKNLPVKWGGLVFDKENRDLHMHT